MGEDTDKQEEKKEPTLSEKSLTGKWPVYNNREESESLNALLDAQGKEETLSEEQINALNYLKGKRNRTFTDKEITELLDALVFEGYMTWTYDLTGHGHLITLRTLTTEESQQAKKLTSKFNKDDTMSYVKSEMDLYAVAMSVVAFGGENIGSEAEQKFKWLKSRSGPITNRIIDAYNNLSELSTSILFIGELKN